MVAWAAMLASPEQRGQVVGSVTSGIVIGILLARFVSGMIADLAGWRGGFLAGGRPFTPVSPLPGERVAPPAGPNVTGR